MVAATEHRLKTDPAWEAAGQQLVYYDPSSAELTSTQKVWLSGWLNTFADSSSAPVAPARTPPW